MIETDTICALSSAPGRAGVAVVRVSGPGARAALERLAGPMPEPRRAALRSIRDPRDGQDIDRGIVLLYAGPSSFTGEDVVEILLHGGRAVVASVLAALRSCGCRLAEPGEFARRAFENGKIDLTEAEGIADLIDAETEAQRRQAVAQAGGTLHRLYESWRGELIDAMALTEAGIDFSDEADVAADAAARAREIVDALKAKLDAHLQDGRRGEILRDGFRVVLAGPPNVGKSSLLNALARRDAAIVSAEAGTTRDVIEVRLDLEGYPVIVSDTAGIREPGGEVEREGIRRTLAQGRVADLVLWVMDATAPCIEVPGGLREGGARIVLVENKVDLVEVVRWASDEPPGLPAASPHVAGMMLEATCPPPPRGEGIGVGGDQSLRFPAAEDSPTPDPSPQGGGESRDGLRNRGGEQLNVSDRRVPISAATGEGLAGLVQLIAAEACERMAPGDGPVITQARHREALEDCARCLQDYLAQDLLKAELAAEDLRRASQALGRITGRVDAEQVLGRIFARFCIGK